MPLHLARPGVGRLTHRTPDLRWGLVTERLLWGSLIGLAILGTMLFLGLFGVLIWGLFWGIPG